MSEWIYPIKDRFKLSERFLEDYKTKKPDWGPLGEITYKRTYAARVEGENRTEEWWETVKRVVNTCYTIQLNHCKNMHLPWLPHKAQKSAQEMYSRMFDFKFIPPGRGLANMGDVVFKRGGMGLFNCFQYDTEIITREGIKKIGDCVGTEQELLVNNSWVTAPISSFGKQQLYKLTLSRSGRKKVIYTTKNHRWFTQDRRKEYRNKDYVEFETHELRPEVHRLQYSFAQNYKNVISPSPFGISHGICFGDGSTRKNKNESNVLILCGDKNKQLLKYFENCNISQLETDDDECDKIYVGNIPNYFKDLPNINENKSYLLGWLMGYFAADGSSVNRSGNIVLSSSNIENLKFVRDVCNILGIGTYEISETNRISNLTNEESELYKLHIMGDTVDEDFFLIQEHKENFINNKKNNTNKKHWTVVSVEETDIIEEVYCATVEKYHKFTLADNIMTGNCSAISTKHIHVQFSDPFVFMMDVSMSGVGCGFDTEGAGTITFVEPTTTEVPFVVDDSREGWCEILKVTLESFVGKEAFPNNIDYSQIRPSGSPIVTSGGTAPGPEPLIKCINDIKEFLTKRIGNTITSSDIVDLMNMIGVCVVSGGKRRTAQIAFGHLNDNEYISLKDPEKFSQELISHRWASNNSVYGFEGMDYSKIIDTLKKSGEPGLVYLNQMQNYGRLKDGYQEGIDGEATLLNPCGEISLESGELCNIADVFPARHDSFDDFKRSLKFAFLYTKTVTLLPTHNELTNTKILKNRRIGVSQSGIMQAIQKHGTAEYFKWCDQGYSYLKELDKKYSNWLCIQKSIKLTTVKPAGTTSLLMGSTPGLHAEHSEYYIRRIRIEETATHLIDAVSKAGYKNEKSVYGDRSIVFEFPVKANNFYKGKDDMTIWEQIQIGSKLQKVWSDNSVSQTVTFKEEEVNDIKNVLELYEGQLKTVSFLPLDCGSYPQMPYETITEEIYNEMIKNIKPINFSSVKNGDTIEKFCDGDKCTI